MTKILGVDLGTNSAGWSIIETTTNEILKTGVRIFPEGVNKDQSGSESPKNLERRVARGIRKNNFRYKLRRNKLKSVLSELGMSPDKKYFTNEKNKNYASDDNGIKIKLNFTYELYELRVKALTEKLLLPELGRVFYHLNTHRGFKSNAKEKALLEFSMDEKQKDNQGKVEKSYTDLQNKINEAKEKGLIKHGTIGEYFFYLIKQNGGSRNINEPISKIRNNDNQEGHYTRREMYEFEFDLIWKNQKEFHNDNLIFSEENKIKLKDETIFYQRDLRSSKHLIGRCSLEFKTYLKIEKGKKIIEKAYLPCCSKSSLLFQEFRIWDSLNNLRYKINDADWSALTLEQKNKFAEILEFEDSIFINLPDRRFKLTKEERKEIELFKNSLFKKLGLPSNAFFNSNKILGNRIVHRLISALGKEYWINQTAETENLVTNFTNIQTGEVLELPEIKNYSATQTNLWHLVQFSSDFTNSQDWILGNIKKKNTNHLKTFELLRLTSTQINKYSSIVFEPGYGSYSSKALKKIIPFLKAGYELHQAEEFIYNKINSDIRSNDFNLLEEIPLLPNNYLRNPIVQQGANEAIRLINSIIDTKEFGKPDEIRIEFTRELKKPREAREQQKRNNDVKESERKKYADFLSKRLNQFIAPRDSRIEKFEFWLELAWSKKSFDEIKDDISLKDFEEFYKDTDNQKVKDYEKKYKLWMECGRILPYTNQIISLSELFSSEIEIEHIIPYSRCFDDSFMNKTLSSKSFNNKKGKLTPLEYFKSVDKKEFDEFKRRIKDFPEGKKKRFLLKTEDVDSFKNSQLNNTSYVTTVLAEHLRKTFKADQIKITSGAVTSIMRKLFGFNDLLNEPIKVDGYKNGAYWAVFDNTNELYTLLTKEDNEAPEYEKEYTIVSGYVNNEYLRIGKTRNDHRHHAVDAIAIAFTNQRMIQFISTITEGYYEKNGKKLNSLEDGALFVSAFDEMGRFTKSVWDAIIKEAKKHFNLKSIRNEAREKISDILISHRSDNKLTSSGKRKVYASSGKPLKTIGKNGESVQFYSGGDVARGQLHEATLYGKIQYNQPMDESKKDWMSRDGVFVYRVPLKYNTKGYFSKIDQLEKIIDPVIRKITIDASAKKGLREALNEGIYLPIKDRKTKEILIESGVIVKSVRIASDSRELNSIRSFKEEKKNYKKAYIETGENYCIAIYGDYECNSREFESVTFLKAAQIEAKNKKLTQKNKPRIDFYNQSKNGLSFLQTLSKGESVLVYKDHPDELDLKNIDKQFLFKRLFKVVKSDKNGIIVLGRHNLGNIKADKDKAVKDLDSKEGSVIRCKYSTIRCIKVEVDRLGNIKPI